MSKQVKTDEMGQWHEFGAYTPARLISLDGEIDEESATQFIKNIRLMDHVSEQDIKVLINSTGGDVSQGLAIVDAIAECDSKVITHVVGAAYSMGAIIFQVGDERWMSANSSLMIHVGEEEYDADHPVNVDAWIKHKREEGERADNILFNRIKEKKPRYKKEKFKELITFDKIYTAEQAIELGLADKVVQHKSF